MTEDFDIYFSNVMFMYDCNLKGNLYEYICLTLAIMISFVVDFFL